MLLILLENYLEKLCILPFSSGSAVKLQCKAHDTEQESLSARILAYGLKERGNIIILTFFSALTVFKINFITTPR